MSSYQFLLRGYQSLFLKYLVSSPIGTYLVPLGGNQGQLQECFGNVWTTWLTTQNTKWTLMPGIGVLLDYFIFFKGTLSAQMRNFHLNYICLLVNLAYIIAGFVVLFFCFWGDWYIVNTVISYDIPEILIILFHFSFFCIFVQLKKQSTR